MSNAFDLIETVLPKLDEPHGDSSILPTYLVCAHARKKVTVALSGDGGDELFAGYDPFKALQMAKTYKAVVPRPVHQAIRMLVNMAPRSDRNMSLEFKLRRTLRALEYRDALWNPVWMGALAPAEISDLFGGPVDPEELYSEAIELWDKAKSKDIVDKALEFFTCFYLQDDILLKSDRASMLNSLELRAPFLDYDLVDFVKKIPNRYKFHNGEGKKILKKSVRRMLPQAIVDRPKKGFGIPLDQWLRDMPKPTPSGILNGLNETWLSTCWDQHKQKSGDFRHALWSWIMLRQNAAISRRH
jgi:asparagine synthase (glutamine-hydrolysing)